MLNSVLCLTISVPVIEWLWQIKHSALLRGIFWNPETVSTVTQKVNKKPNLGCLGKKYFKNEIASLFSQILFVNPNFGIEL